MYPFQFDMCFLHAKDILITLVLDCFRMNVLFLLYKHGCLSINPNTLAKACMKTRCGFPVYAPSWGHDALGWWRGRRGIWYGMNVEGKVQLMPYIS
jgi:hypothetical protein